METKKRDFNPGDVVKHFKRETVDQNSSTYLYKIIGIATHTETREPMMVYQALYGDCQLYVRPYEMFMGKVDEQKYPDIKQKYRFEKSKLSEKEKEMIRNTYRVEI
ncbi:Protein of unknown function (DUF1653) [Lachnospiraceae bacterium JC7]|nr:Protein of unknown function (DUF1653) [Lachnospiraceae bacterium JC7]